MNILFFMEDYYLGGLDTFVINLINNWPEKKDRITLLCNRQHTGIDFIRNSISRECAILTHDILSFNSFFELEKTTFVEKFIKFFFKFTSPISRYLFFIYTLLKLKNIFSHRNYEYLMIINGGYPGGDSCRAASIAWASLGKNNLSVHNFHGIVSKSGFHIALQEKIIDNLVKRVTKKFITVSKAALNSMSSKRSIFHSDKLVYIYNGVEIKNSTKKNSFSIRKELGLPDSSKLCLSVGGYHRHKNFDKGYLFLVQVFKKVLREEPYAHLLICGYGTELDKIRIKKEIKEKDVSEHIHLLGFRRDLHNIIPQIDVMLVGSQVFESFCLATIEAMAYKKPVVATSVGAIPEIIKNGEGGFCVPKEEGDLFANLVINLLNDSKLRQEKGQKGYERYLNQFTAKRMAWEYAKLLCEN